MPDELTTPMQFADLGQGAPPVIGRIVYVSKGDYIPGPRAAEGAKTVLLFVLAIALTAAATYGGIQYQLVQERAAKTAGQLPASGYLKLPEVVTSSPGAFSRGVPMGALAQQTSFSLSSGDLKAQLAKRGIDFLKLIAWAEKYGPSLLIPVAMDLISGNWTAAIALAAQQGPQCVIDLLVALGITIPIPTQPLGTSAKP